MFSQFKLDRDFREALGVAAVMGYHLVSGPLVGYGMGWFLDNLFKTDPTLKFVFLILGIIAGFRMIFQDVQKLNRLQEKIDQKKNQQDSSEE